MTVNFNPNVVTSSVKMPENLGFDPTKPPTISAASAVETGKAQADKVEIQKNPEQKGEKKGLVQGAKDIVRAMKKFGITISEYTKGTFKGVGEGFLVGASIFTVGSAVNGIKKSKSFPVKSLSVIGAIATVGVNYWNTSLNANKKKADVDHKYTSTPIVGK